MTTAKLNRTELARMAEVMLYGGTDPNRSVLNWSDYTVAALRRVLRDECGVENIEEYYFKMRLYGAL